MKVRILIPIVIFLIASVFVGNWIYGNMLAKKIDAYIQKSDIGTEIKYDKVSVSPLWSSVKFENFHYSDQPSINIKSKQLALGIKYTEAMEVAKTGKINSLSKLNADFEDVEVAFNETKVFQGESVTFNFNGDLKMEQLLNIQEQFPKHDQKVWLSMENCELNYFPKSFDLTDSNEYGKIHSATLEILFKPSENKLYIEDFKIDSELLNIVAETKIDLVGDGLREAKPVLMDVKYDAKLNKAFDVGDRHKQFSVDQLTSFFEGIIEFDEKGDVQSLPKEANFSLYAKDLVLGSFGKNDKGAGGMISLLKIDPEDLTIKELSINSSVESGEFKIEDTKLVLPILEASMEATFDATASKDLKNADIRDLKIRISNIEEGIANSLNGLGSTFGFKIPKDGDDILLEIKGSLKNPQIKGIHY